jgi:squalene-associated FAD-dependent desaturase
VTAPAPRAADAVVVGGGFAGLAAATRLAEQGARVVLLEARPYLGGRARSWVDPVTGTVVDNGQHLFMGCYDETLRFLGRVGGLDGLELQERLALPFLEPGGRLLTFRLPPLPSPWNLAAGLLRYPGLSPAERFGLLRVGREVARRTRRAPAAAGPNGPAAPAGPADLDAVSVDAWLSALGQGERARARLWHPVAIAALNEEPGRASAAMFLPVLRQAFLRGAAASRLGLPRVGLSQLYAEPAARYLKGRGCEVRLRVQARRILLEGGRCAGVLLPDGTRLHAGAVIAATPPPELIELLPAGSAEPSLAGLARLESAPIVSVYLWFGSPVTDLKFAGLLGGTWQWMFNRRGIAGGGGPAHPITLVRSAARDLVDRPREALERSALEDARVFLPSARRAALRHALVVKERRATLAPLCGSLALRPAGGTPWQGLHLAGDWIATGLPATVEGAAWSGHAAAAAVLAGG